MKNTSTLFAIVSTLAFGAVSQSALAFSLNSTDINAGESMSSKHEFNGFGCTGDDLSPQLSWDNAPEGTEAFAITAYDPDAPTGSGWWHWQVINIPASVTELATGAGSADSKLLPAISQTIRNDYGTYAFGGACPPEGHGVHRYQFTVHALKQKLALPDSPSAALTGYMINANSLATATLEALYER